MKMNKNAQVWIETVLYTIIGLALIATVLTFITPKINETRDKIVIEQSIQSLQVLDDKIQEVISDGTGSKRVIKEFNLKRGELLIDPVGNRIILSINDLDYLYSESGSQIDFGRIKITSGEGQRDKYINLELNYKSNTLKYEDVNEQKKISAASTPYTLSLESKNDDNVNYVNIVIER